MNHILLFFCSLSLFYTPIDSLNIKGMGKVYARKSEQCWIIKKGEKYALYSNSLKPITQFKFDTIADFDKHLAVFGATIERNKLRYGLINRQGKIVLKVISKKFLDFRQDIAALFKSHNQWGYIDRRSLKIVMIPHFISIDDFRGGLGGFAWRKMPGMHYYFGNDNDEDNKDIRLNFINRDLQFVIPSLYDSVGEYRKGLVRIVMRNKKYGFLDSTATLIGKIDFEDIDILGEFQWKGMRRIKKNGLYGFLDNSTGQLVIQPVLEDSKPSNLNIVWVKNKGKWGCIDSLNHLKIAFRYDVVTPFNEGLAGVGINKKFGHIDTNGKVITPLTYDKALPFNNGMAAVFKDGKYGFVNKNGHLAIPLRYSYATYFEQDKAKVDWYSLILFIDKNGNLLDFKLQGYWFWAFVFICIVLFKILIYNKLFENYT